MNIGWFAKMWMALYTWFTGKQEQLKPSQPIKQKVMSFDEFTPYVPDPNYSTWYRKTFERPRRKRRF